ncbi:MAG: hypothetical protein H8D94_00105 [Candidatus Pelagibacter sp.]|nr:hypothetical protein [Candidatus Pelagibacter sp.]
MASIFVTSNEVKAEGFLGKDISVPFYLQFVPGYVVKVITSNISLAYDNNLRNQNSIIAKSHINYNPLNKGTAVGEEGRYYPMFRGIVDVPAKGDPVLLVTIGNINYYLGPLNVINNPNWNFDNMKIDDFSSGPQEDTPTARELRGESLNYDKTLHKRLIKTYKNDLDKPHGAVNEIHGDLMFEGRHGNSIRIGSRSANPYIFISNGRSEGNYVEGTKDGSLISITKDGSIRQHFGGDSKIKSTNIVSEPFILSSDLVSKNTRLIAGMVTAVNGGSDATELIYNYNKNQILQTSDRITINAKKDNLFLSSIGNIHIGAGNNLTISVNNDLIIDSRNIYLGKPYDGNESFEMEPMVLGQELANILNDLITCLSTANFFSITGAPLPLIDSTGTQIASMPGVGRKSLESIQGEINNILSSYHFIEKNGQPNK